MGKLSRIKHTAHKGNLDLALYTQAGPELCGALNHIKLLKLLAACLCFGLLLLSSQSNASMEEFLNNSDQALVKYGCEHDTLRRTMEGFPIKTDYVTDSLTEPGGLALRYRWSDHETRVVGPDLVSVDARRWPGEVWRYYVLSTVIAGSSLPEIFKGLNSPRGKEYLLASGFDLRRPDDRFTGVELFARRFDRSDNSTIQHVSVIYAGSLVSSITWNCIP